MDSIYVEAKSLANNLPIRIDEHHNYNHLGYLVKIELESSILEKLKQLVAIYKADLDEHQRYATRDNYFSDNLSTIKERYEETLKLVESFEKRTKKSN